MPIIPYSSIVEPNGKTIRENNLETRHAIPLGTLVETQVDTYYGQGASIKGVARMFVCKHSRDCDGTTLYSLTPHYGWYTNLDFNSSQVRDAICRVENGYAEDSLKVVTDPEL
jgi:hypothetical protein